MENAKQKAIRLAYINLIGEEKYNYIKDFIDENGISKRGKWWWLKDNFEENFIKENFYVSVEIDNDKKLRPKSLQGIETNNNWIKIESEKDLPSDLKVCQFIPCNSFDEKFIGFIIDDEVYFIDKYTKVIDNKAANLHLNSWLKSQITHYKLIDTEPKPIY